jgi:hypothetical protein
MDRRTLLEHLALAERHLQDGERHLAEQRARIEERRRDGHDISEAMELLAAMEAAQRQHKKGLDLIRQQLGAANPSGKD